MPSILLWTNRMSWKCFVPVLLEHDALACEKDFKYLKNILIFKICLRSFSSWYRTFWKSISIMTMYRLPETCYMCSCMICCVSFGIQKIDLLVHSQRRERSAPLRELREDFRERVMHELNPQGHIQISCGMGMGRGMECGGDR